MSPISSQKILTHPLTVKKPSLPVPSIKYSDRSSGRHNSRNENLHMLINFLQEKHFVLNKSKTHFVLSKVPFYRMDLISTVTADKNRGNIYSRLNLTNLSSLARTKFNHPNSILGYNKGLFGLFNSVRSKNLLNTSINSLTEVSTFSNRFRSYYYSPIQDGQHLIFHKNPSFTRPLIQKLKNKLRLLPLSFPSIKFRSVKKTKKLTLYDKRLLRKQNHTKKILKLKSLTTTQHKTRVLKKVKLLIEPKIPHLTKSKKKTHIEFTLAFLN